MSEEQKKIGFFKSLKNSLLSSEEKDTSDLDEDNIMKEIKVKTVSPDSINKEEIQFKGISTSQELDIRFAENFVDSGGKFIFSENLAEVFRFLESLKGENEWNNVFASSNMMKDLLNHHNFQTNSIGFLLNNSDAAISFCYSLSADEGVVILSPEEASDRRNFSFPKNHIILAYRNQLKENIDDAILGFKEQFDSRLPSVLELYDNRPVARSNHKTLLSAEGPQNVFLFYIDSEVE